MPNGNGAKRPGNSQTATQQNDKMLYSNKHAKRHTVQTTWNKNETMSEKATATTVKANAEPQIRRTPAH